MENRIKEMIHYATLAPSGHNTQPWQFLIRDNCVVVYPDHSRRLPVVDPDDHALFISLGCALENLIVAANHMGYRAQVDYLPPDEGRECIRVGLVKETVDSDPVLFAAIPERQSTRSQYDGNPIPTEHLEQLEKAGEQDGVSLRIFSDIKEIEPIIELAKEANIAQFSDQAFVRELIQWIRFSKKEALTRLDGLNAASMGLPFGPNWLGKFIINHFATPKGEAKKCEKLIRASSGLALFIAKSNDKESWIKLGQSFERLALKATALNLKHAHLNMPCEVLEVRKKLQRHLGLENEHPLLLIRIGYANPRPRSYRRPVDDVLINN